ncbi:unnamed protein product, partial [Thlaspi arvense]
GLKSIDIMPSVPSKLLVLLLLSLIPSLTPYHSGLSSHRLKPLEKCDWRARFNLHEKEQFVKSKSPETQSLTQSLLLFAIGGARFSTHRGTTTVTISCYILDMSSVCDKLDFKDADFEISTSSPTQCSSGSKHSSHAGSEDSQESDGDETGYIDQTANEDSAEKDFGKSTLSSLPPQPSDDEEKEENVTNTPVVLIPAIKGSREKHGLSLRKSSVSWADDVYDPPPSIASHTRSKKQQQKSKSKDNHKKTGKKGQKSKDNSSSRSGKDKKQASRKHSREKFDWFHTKLCLSAIVSVSGGILGVDLDIVIAKIATPSLSCGCTFTCSPDKTAL